MSWWLVTRVNRGRLPPNFTFAPLTVTLVLLMILRAFAMVAHNSYQHGGVAIRQADRNVIGMPQTKIDLWDRG